MFCLFLNAYINNYDACHNLHKKNINCTAVGQRRRTCMTLKSSALIEEDCVNVLLSVYVKTTFAIVYFYFFR